MIVPRHATAILKRARSAADLSPVKSVIGICATFGMFAGGYVPELWGASSLSLASVVCGALGGVAGVWIGARLAA